jgi:hypothetical protein
VDGLGWSALLRVSDRAEALRTSDALDVYARHDVANLGAMNGFAITRIAGDHAVFVQCMNVSVSVIAAIHHRLTSSVCTTLLPPERLPSRLRRTERR